MKSSYEEYKLRKELWLSIILMLTSAQIMPALGNWNIFGNLFGSKPEELETLPTLCLGYVPTVHSIDPVVLDKLYAPNFKNMKPSCPVGHP
jgi:hypothetical protein